MAKNDQYQAMLEYRKYQIIHLHELFKKINRACQPYQEQSLNKSEMEQSGLALLLMDYMACGHSTVTYACSNMLHLKNNVTTRCHYSLREIFQCLETQSEPYDANFCTFSDSYDKILRLLSMRQTNITDLMNACRELGRMAERICNRLAMHVVALCREADPSLQTAQEPAPSVESSYTKELRHKIIQKREQMVMRGNMPHIWNTSSGTSYF